MTRHSGGRNLVIRRSQSRADSDDASLTTDEFIRRAIMPDAYKKAADILVASSQDDPANRNYLVFPIIFSYRHFLELSLKYQIDTFGPAVGIEPNWSSHDLSKLWVKFLDLLEQYRVTDPDNANEIVQQTILEFAKIDPYSDSYRYPVDRKGNTLPIAYAELHLPSLMDVMDSIENYFSGCDGYLDNLRHASGS